MGVHAKDKDKRVMGKANKQVLETAGDLEELVRFRRV